MPFIESTSRPAYIYDALIDAWIPISGQQGPIGLQGTTGPQGITGSGAQGTTGIQGSFGTQGTQGIIGTQGIQGIIGNYSTTLTIIQKTTGYTIASGDEGDMIEMSSTSPITLSIPTDATFNFAIGTQINILQTNTGQVTIAAVTPGTTTVVGTPGLKLRTQWSSATIVKRAANSWVVMGDTVV